MLVTYEPYAPVTIGGENGRNLSIIDSDSRVHGASNDFMHRARLMNIPADT